MSLKLKKTSSPTPAPFSWDSIDSSPSPLPDPASLPSPPTSWLSARDMKLFGAQPLTSGSEIGIVKCKDCGKPVLKSFVMEHADNCQMIRAGGKKPGLKGKAGIEAEDPKKGSKKRKASLSPDDPSLPAKKKAKPATKVTKGRFKGPVDYDRQCGVINDKGLPCSRSLTCKSHSMGAKRAVQGRSRDYDELLIEWQRANNPNWVEPVKRETKAEKKEKREKEKAEKKRLAGEKAGVNGVGDGNTPGKKATTNGSGTGKKGGGKKAAAAAAAASKLAEGMGEDVYENLDDLDSEAEMDDLVRAYKGAMEKGVVAVPLATPCDAGSWFVQRREKARCCRDLLVGALGNGGGTAGHTGLVTMSRTGSIGHGASVLGGTRLA